MNYDILHQDRESLITLKDGTVQKTVYRPQISFLGYPSARKLTQREIKALELLVGIEGVPQLVSQESETSFCYKYINATPLRKYKSRLPKQYFDELAILIERCEERGVYRVDLDRSSILVTKEGKPALIDFGYAIFSDDSIARIPLVLRLAKIYRALRIYDLRKRYATK